MASPVAHSFAGFWTFLLFTGRSKVRLPAGWRQYLPALAVLVLLANLPDFDILIELAARRDLHRGVSHSLAAAIFVAVGLSCIWRITPGFWRSGALYFIAYGSHLVIDFCTGRTLGWNTSGSGIPLFWPWAKDFSSRLVLVPGVIHKNFPAVLSIQNARSGFYELISFGAITTALLVWRARHEQGPPAPLRQDAAVRAGSNSNLIR